MKKQTLTLLALLALTLIGCKEPTPEERQQIQERFQKIDDENRRDALHTVEYNGHSYIIYQGRYKGGITHDPDWLASQTDMLSEDWMIVEETVD